MTKANEELVRKGYAAFSAGDMATLTEVFAPGAVWHQPGNNLASGEYEGRDAIFGFSASSASCPAGRFAWNWTACVPRARTRW